MTGRWKHVSILRESTKAQIGLLRLYRGEAGRPDWAPWNEAMAVIQLVGRSEMALEVHEMDKVFWESNSSIEYGEVINDGAWAAIRDAMEGARLKFTNAARRKLVGSSEPLSRLAWRPPAAARAEDPVPGLRQAEGQETNRYREIVGVVGLTRCGRSGRGARDSQELTDARYISFPPTCDIGSACIRPGAGRRHGGAGGSRGLDGTKPDGLKDRDYLLTANGKHSLTSTTLCRNASLLS